MLLANSLVILLITIAVDCVSLQSRVIGGTGASITEFPYQISLRYVEDNSHFCSGAIISHHWILTAAHCVYDMTTADFYIVAGTAYLDKGGSSYDVDQFILHQDFDKVSLQNNDIALVRVVQKIRFNDKKQPVELADKPVSDGSDAWLTGWGYVTSPPKFITPNQLQKVVVQTVSLNDCRNILSWLTVHNGTVCTFAGKGKGTCQGDSGGPLVSGRQIGIVSWNIPCADGYPDVYTSVPYYRSWIRANAGI